MDQSELSDRIEIQDALTRYATAVDRNDWKMFRSLFTAEANMDCTSAGFIAGPVDELLPALEQSMKYLAWKQTSLSNIDIDRTGDAAKVTAMFSSPMLFQGATDPSFAGGYYHFDFVRTPEGWAVERLVEQQVWFTNPPTGPFE